MAISLKEQLQILKEGVHYHAPHINVMKKGKEDGNTRKKATQMFYDFYAMELMHRMLGSPRPDPDLGKVAKGELTPQQANKLKAAVQTAPMKGVNPMGAMFVKNWDDVEEPMGGAGIVPAQLRKVIDQVYEEVVIQLTQKMLAHLRLTLVQEFRYLVTHASDWQSFRQRLVSIYNKNGGKITKQEFQKAIEDKIPAMKGHEDAVQRLLKFCKYYSSMSPDPADAIPKDAEVPKVGSPITPPEPEPTSEPEPEPEEPKAQEPSEPDDTDYDQPEVDIPPGADWDDDAWKNYSDEAEKAKMIQWIKQHKKLTEGLHDPGYAAGRISPHTILAVRQAINKSGLTWGDILLAYQNLNWGGAYGGPKWGAGVEAFIKLMPQASNQNVEDMAGIVDHIYDLEHNTGELLNKGGMFVGPHDLDRRAKVTHLARYLPDVSPIVNRLILRVLHYISDHPEVEKNISTVTQSPTQPFPADQSTKLTASKFIKSSAGNEWTTQAPYENKKGVTVQDQYTAKFHANGMYSIQDTMNADVQVFDNWDKFISWVDNHQNSFIVPQPGLSHYSAPKVKSEKEAFLDKKTKIKLDGAKEKQLLDICKMGWRPSNHYYKAYLPGDDRFQFFAFDDGTYMGCIKSTKKLGGTFDNWNAAFEYCKAQTANALPNQDSAESQMWIGKKIDDAPSTMSPSGIPITPKPSVGGVPHTEYGLAPIEINMLQILVNKKGGKVTVEPNVAPEGFTIFSTKVNTPNVPIHFNVVAVGKKPISPTGKKYVVHHAVHNGPTEDWNFANWNQTYGFIANNFDALIQTENEVKSSVQTSVTPQMFAATTNAPMPVNSPSKASYKVHLGIAKPPTHTIRLTVDDEAVMKSIGFEPSMQGSDVWYIHNKIGDVVKFFPNDIAKILFIKTNDKIIVTKKIDDALAWLTSKYQGATTSPVVAATPQGAKGSKAGAMYEGMLVTAGFQWDANVSKYINQSTADTIVIAPFPKSTYTDAQTGQQQHFQTLPSLAVFLKSYNGSKKKY